MKNFAYITIATLLLSACSKIGFMKLETTEDVPKQTQARRTLASQLLPVRIHLTGPTLFDSSVCSGFKATTEAQNGLESGVNGDLDFSMSANFNVTFFSDSGCSKQTSSFKIKTGYSSTVFYLKSKDEGSLRIVASTKFFQTATGVPATFPFDAIVQNTPPTGNNGSFGFTEDITNTGKLVSQDTNGDTVSYLVQTYPQHTSGGGMFIVPDNGGNFTYRPTPDYFGSDFFTYYISDGKSLSALKTATISVAGTQDAPVLSMNATLPVSEGFSANITQSFLWTTDVDNPPTTSLVYTLLSLPVNGVVRKNSSGLSVGSTFTQADIDANRIDYVHDDSETTSDSFTFSVTDGQPGGSLASKTFNIQVNAVNDIPLLKKSAPLAVNEESSANITPTELEYTDAEGNTVTYTIIAKPTRGTLFKNGVALVNGSTFNQGDINTGNKILYTHDGSETTSDSFTYSVSDGQGGFINNRTFSISVTAVNDAPKVVNNLGTTLKEGASVAIARNRLEYSDAEGNTVTYTLTSVPANGTLLKNSIPLSAGQTFTQADINGTGLIPLSKISYQHDNSETTSDGFTFTVSDGLGGNVGVTSFSITITPVNDPPTANTTSFNVVEETLFSGTLSGSDPEGNSLTYSLVSPAGKGTASVNSSGAFTYLSAVDATGTDSFTFKVCDTTPDCSASATVTLSIANKNDRPNVLSRVIGTAKNTAVNVSLTASDVDTGDALTLTANQPANPGASVSFSGNLPLLVTYRPANGFVGDDTFTYSATDNGKTNGSPDPLTGTATVTVKVDPPPSVVPHTLCVGPLVSAPIKTGNLDPTVPGISNPTKPTIIYKITEVPQHGSLKRTPNSTALGVGDTFSQQEIVDQEIVYEKGTGGASDAFEFTLDYMGDGNPSGAFALPMDLNALTCP